jgi:Protein of unknown function (DUF3237)
MRMQEISDGIEVLRWKPLFVMRLKVGYERAYHIGQGPGGGRSMFPVDGGHFEGERLAGTVNPDGADWVQWRSDGAFMIDVRLTMTTNDGAPIAMSYVGIAYADAAIMERFKRRENLAFQDIYTRTTPRFETADPRYAWLNRIVSVANGMRTPPPGGPLYHVFEIA